MAETTGLGRKGKNGLLFNSTWGPRLMIGGVLTTAQLPEMTFPEKDGAECPKECFVCQDACPARAIDRVGKVDRIACAKHSMRSPLFSHLMKSIRPGTEDISSIFNATAVDGNAIYTCTKCVSECPRCQEGFGTRLQGE
jgi:epoxyqueuosine reductase QueG